MNEHKQRKYTVAYLFVLTFSLVIFSFYVKSFPDYDGYHRYITEFTALDRFLREPLSGVLMLIIGKLGGGGLLYYLISTAFFALSVVVFLIKNRIYSVLFFAFYVLNPMCLIIFHVPRFTMALGFLMLALSTRKIWLSVCLLLFAILTHTVMGLYAFLLYFAFVIGRRYYAMGMLTATLIFFAILFGFIDTHYTMYMVGEHDRGRFRLLMFAALFVLGLLSLKNWTRDRLNFLTIFTFGIIAYIATPFAHRFLVPNLLLLSLIMQTANLAYLNRLLFSMYQYIALFATLCVLALQMFDYTIHQQ